MTTISNNKLPEWSKALNSAVENYQSTQTWYEENPDSPSAEQDMDAAAGEIEKLLKQYGVLIVLSLMDEIDELQERRKADSEPAGYHVIKECGKVGCSVATLEEAEKTRDFWNKKWIIKPYFYAPPVQETGVYKDMLNIIGLLENNEWAEHCTSTVLGSLLESEITRLVGATNPAPVVPDEWTIQDAVKFCRETGRQDAGSAMDAWNACRAAMLQVGEPVSQTYNLPELIEGMEVSIDVSTCDADAGNRYFGTVTEVSELYTARNGYILLVQDAKPNFDVNGNTPVQSPIDHGYRPECECSGCKATARICAELNNEEAEIFADGYNAAMQSFGNSEQLNSPVTPDGWISCSERMPDNDESKPIAIFTGKCLGQGMFVATYDDDGFFDYWEGMEIIGVTHWMPLPAPPQK